MQVPNSKASNHPRSFPKPIDQRHRRKIINNPAVERMPAIDQHTAAAKNAPRRINARAASARGGPSGKHYSWPRTKPAHYKTGRLLPPPLAAAARSRLGGTKIAAFHVCARAYMLYYALYRRFARPPRRSIPLYAPRARAKIYISARGLSSSSPQTFYRRASPASSIIFARVRCFFVRRALSYKYLLSAPRR